MFAQLPCVAEMTAKRDRPPRESWGRHIYQPYLRPVKGSSRRKRPITAISIAMLAAAISLGIALALVIHVFG